MRGLAALTAHERTDRGAEVGITVHHGLHALHRPRLHRLLLLRLVRLTAATLLLLLLTVLPGHLLLGHSLPVGDSTAGLLGDGLLEVARNGIDAAKVEGQRRGGKRESDHRHGDKLLHLTSPS